MRLTSLLAVSLLPVSAHAFCGFYVSGADQTLFNNATQVVLMREGLRTVLSMQNNYQGPAKDFAMVVPVPVILQKENVKTLSRDVFTKIDRLAAPRLVEYWERDPCYVQPPVKYKASSGVKKMERAPMKDSADDDLRDYGVKIEAKFTVGEYDIVVLAANDALGLDRWLRDNKYKIPAGAEPLFKPYIQQGWKFFVAKVDVSKVELKDGQAALSPLRFHYDSEAFTLPIRLGLINANQKQDLIVHILAKGTRYEVANYPNVTVPTNIDLHESAKVEFPAFYASLFDRTLQKNPKAVVTEYAWSSASCDPCPLPPLNETELDVLGRDVLLGGAELPQIEVKNADKLSPEDKAIVDQYLSNLNRTLTQRRGLSAYNFVLTRLHARYDKASLGEDLVFKAAGPIMGGREHMATNGKLEQGSMTADSSQNNFQGRYAVRHVWKGPITCSNPVRGRWGGPWPGVTKEAPQAATDTAFAPRKAELAEKLAESPVAELGIKGKKEHAGMVLP
ncbi:MAG: DUF2330 domain-containing protein [Myxococcaceae bacterium]|nr:DUF2330 domain-containing protein [Myxococcaceae bacterium]